MTRPLFPRPTEGSADERLRAFVHQPVTPPPEAYAGALRERTVGAMDAQRARLATGGFLRSRSWRILFAAAACVVFASAAFATLRFRASVRVSAVEVTALAGAAEIVRLGVEHPLAESTTASMGDNEELHTGDDALVRASLSNGAVVDVGPSARVRIHRTGDALRGPARNRIELGGGKIQVRVPKLPDGDELSVHTDAVTVVVHGTRFSVERSAGETRVAVTEGKVAVSSGGEERILTAGDSWVVPEPADAKGLRVVTPPDPQAGRGEPPPDAAARSTLAEENALLADALVLRRDRHEGRAIAVLDDLLRRYPTSPLAETARVERLRALQGRGDEARLRREAARYLADYPHGYARREATLMIASASAPRP